LKYASVHIEVISIVKNNIVFPIWAFILFKKKNNRITHPLHSALQLHTRKIKITRIIVLTGGFLIDDNFADEIGRLIAIPVIPVVGLISTEG